MARLDLDLDEALARRIEQCRVLVAGVTRPKLGADRQYHVRFRDHRVGSLEPEVAEYAQSQWMCFWEYAFARSRGRHGDAQPLREPLQSRLSLTHPDAVT